MAIFLSHSSKDAAVVDRICHRLLEKNVSVWRDIWRLRPGEVVAEEIAEQVRRAGHFCILVSGDAMRSDWVRAELRYALELKRGGFIIPLRLDETELPPELRDIKWIDLRKNVDEGIDRLLDVVGTKYNVNFSGRIDDGLDIWFDHTVAVHRNARNPLITIDAVAHDLSATYSILIQAAISIETDDLAALYRDKTDHDIRVAILGPVIERLGELAKWVIVNGNAQVERVEEIGGRPGAPSTSVRMRIVRMGDVPRNAAVVPVAAYLRQLGIDRGVLSPPET